VCDKWYQIRSFLGHPLLFVSFCSPDSTSSAAMAR